MIGTNKSNPQSYFLLINFLNKFYEIRPKKSLGQNFLIDKNIINKYRKQAIFQHKEQYLEIGPELEI